MIKKGMVFGVFDDLHDGHQHFLTQALERSETVTVVVTRDSVVEILKKRKPEYPYNARAAAINNFNTKLVVIPGDASLGSWEVLATHRPDMVFLGYDQQAIARELEKLGVPFTFLSSYHPEKYKSSLRRDWKMPIQSK